MQAAPDGTIWVAANVPPLSSSYAPEDDQDLTGADIWRSSDRGRTFRWVAAPFAPVEGEPGSLGGRDSDITVAQHKNPLGHYTVAAVSLYDASSELVWSMDNGESWKRSVLSGAPIQDRPWIVSDGPCLVQITSRQVGTYEPALETFNTCSGQPSGAVELVPAADTSHQVAAVLTGSNLLAKHAVDDAVTSPFAGSIYVPMSQCSVDDPTASPLATECQPGGAEHLLAVSHDHGVTFQIVRVARQADNRRALVMWPSSVATDATGALYFVWHDNHDAFLQISHDGGATFTRPAALNSGLGAAAYPTVAATGHGTVVIAALVADRTGDVNDLTVFRDPQTGGSQRATWRLWMWRTLDGGKTIARGPRSGAVHRGVICTRGSSCTSSNGDRDMYDDFGVTVFPDGGAVATINDDHRTSRPLDNAVAAVTLPAE